jgi:hypothetical protein
VKHLPVVLLLCCSVVLAGCAGSSARTAALKPLAEQWPAVEEEALLGIRARAHPMCAQILGAPHESAGVAELRASAVVEYGRMLRAAAEKP